MNANIKNEQETSKENENKTGGSYEKEKLPDNLTDIKSLRSIFELDSNRKDAKRSHQTPPLDDSPTKSTTTVPQKASHGKNIINSPTKCTPNAPQKASHGNDIINSTTKFTLNVLQKASHDKDTINSPNKFTPNAPQKASHGNDIINSTTKFTLNVPQKASHGKDIINSPTKSTPNVPQKASHGKDMVDFPMKSTSNVPQKASHGKDMVDSPTKSTPNLPQKASHGEDLVDCSQPSMGDLLTKFRQLELETVNMRNPQGRISRKLQADEFTQRSVSLDRKANLKYERKVKETSRSAVNGMTIDERLQAVKSKTTKRKTDQQSQNHPVKSLSEEKHHPDGNGSKESDIPKEYNVSVDIIKRNLEVATVKQIAEKQMEREEFPSEGIVQTLLNQWKTLEVSQQSLATSQKTKKRVRFGVDSAWLPQNETLPANKSSKQIKSCLKPTTPTTATERNNVKLKVSTAHESRKTITQEDKVNSNAPKATASQPLLTTNPTNSQSQPPDIVSQVSDVEKKPVDELPPPSNTKTLLEKFRAMQTQTST